MTIKVKAFGNAQLTSGCRGRLKHRAATPTCSSGRNLEAGPPQVSPEWYPRPDRPGRFFSAGRSPRASTGICATGGTWTWRYLGYRAAAVGEPSFAGASGGAGAARRARGTSRRAHRRVTPRRQAHRGCLLCALAMRAPLAFAAASPQGRPWGTRTPPRAGRGRGRGRRGRRKNLERKERAGRRGGGSSGGGKPAPVRPALAQPPALRTSLAPPPRGPVANHSAAHVTSAACDDLIPGVG